MIFSLVVVLFIVVGALMWVLLEAKAPKVSRTGMVMLFIGLGVFCFVNGQGGRDLLGVHVLKP